MRNRNIILFTTLSISLLVLFVLDLIIGSVYISLKDVWGTLIGSEVDTTTRLIVFDIRLMKAIVAVVAGVALSVSGLQMQTLFRNPLAGPYVLGISSGASLGVAIFILGMPILGITNNGIISSIGTAGAAWIGSALILVFIASVSTRIKDIMVILILGMMFSSGVSAVVQILQYMSNEEALKSFVIWTMGSLGDVTYTQLKLLLPAVIIGLILSILVIKPLNLLLLGEQYGIECPQVALSYFLINDIVGRNRDSFLRSYRICRIGDTSRLKNAVLQCRPSCIIASIGIMRSCHIIVMRHHFQMSDSSNQHHYCIVRHSYCNMGCHS